jgi:PII-like signaling protein
MSEEHTLTTRERLRIYLREARRTTGSPIVEAQLDAALDT